jgi:hypothetical protein
MDDPPAVDHNGRGISERDIRIGGPAVAVNHGSDTGHRPRQDCRSRHRRDVRAPRPVAGIAHDENNLLVRSRAINVEASNNGPTGALQITVG